MSMRCVGAPIRAACLLSAVVLFAVPAQGQGADAAGPVSPARPLVLTPGSAAAASAAPSRWSADLERLDQDVRLRLLTPGDPLSNWVRASLDVTDIASQVTHYTGARVAAPQESLYLASLATACMQPTQPVLPECDAVDRLADWARRDQDNGVPDILLAERARRRGAIDTMAADLDEAAAKPRYDDYWARGTLAFWDYFKALPLDFDPAARAVAAVTYATTQPVTWPAALQGMCASAEHRPPQAARDACAKLGGAMMHRAGTWTGRLMGITIAAANASDPSRQAAIEAARGSINQQRARCNDLLHARFEGLESADPAVRSRALAAGEAYVRSQAQYGEVGACERLGASP
jgi:hypothetical protein